MIAVDSSQELHERALARIPGGVNSPVRAFGAVGGRPRFIERAQGCRLWDVETKEKLDKDRFRRDLGKVEEAYQEVARRLGVLPEAGPVDIKGPKVMQ